MNKITKAEIHNVRPGTKVYSADNQYIYLPCIFKRLMLFFMLTVSALAYAEDNQEIGVPVIPKPISGRYLDGAFMAQDGKHFYTLHEGLLTKLSLDPFQKVFSTEVDYKEIKSGKNFFKMFITPDGKKLIISNNKKGSVSLYNIQTGELVNNLTIKTEHRKFGIHPKSKPVYGPGPIVNMMVDAILNDREFLVFTKKEIIVFEADTLIEKRRVPINWHAGIRLSSVHKVFDKIVYMSLEEVGVIDRESYKKREFYRYLDERVSWPCENVGETSINFDLNSIKNDAIKRFNFCGRPVENSEGFEAKRTIRLGFGPTSTAGNYLIRSYGYKLENLKTTKKYRIVPYQDGEVVLFDTSSENKIVLTPKARKHLKMKTSSGEIVPMNDATYKAFKINSP